MKKIKISLVVLFVAMLGLALTSNAQTQKKKQITVEVQGKAVEKNRGANPNIKVDMPTVDKPVAKNRGADDCTITLDNYTGLYIKVYVDGYYKGTLDAWGKGTVSVGSGYTTVYCISAGGTQEWATDGNCEGYYYFKIK